MGRNRQYGGFNVYRGTRRQIGGSIFGTIGKFIRPLAARIIPALGRTAKSALKEVAKSALNVGVRTAEDALAGRNIGEAFKTHAKKEAQRQAGRAVRHVSRRMRGRGLRRSISLDCQVGGGGNKRKRTRSRSLKRKKKPTKRRKKSTSRRRKAAPKRRQSKKRQRRQPDIFG